MPQLASPPPEWTSHGSLLAKPTEPPERLLEPRASSSEELFVLTNRFGPIKIACRVLSNMRREGRGPTIEDFQESAAKSARQLGLKLRERELAEGLRGSRRISTAFPVGKNERAGLNRFIASFTVGENQGAVSGPLAILGLANIEHGSVYLTEAGWELASAPSPLLGEAAGTTLSTEESTILIKRVAESPGERRAVRRFLDVVKKTGGTQSKVDAELRRANPSWRPGICNLVPRGDERTIDRPWCRERGWKRTESRDSCRGHAERYCVGRTGRDVVSKINAKLSKELFGINNQKDLEVWLAEAMKSLAGVTWKPLGQNENNVHTVEVASDPALALIERPTNSIDALLDLRHMELQQDASSPHEAAQKWFGIPKGGLSEASAKESTRLNLADLVRITLHESDDRNRPTISIQDQGTGQHPDNFEDTLLSLHGSNKKSARHLMGVYGAGGAASYRFARSTLVISRRAPQLLDGRPDEIGMTLVRYNKLDAEKYKTGRYEYLATLDGKIPRLEAR